jgi:hypothetical protein
VNSCALDEAVFQSEALDGGVAVATEPSETALLFCGVQLVPVVVVDAWGTTGILAAPGA